MAKQYPFGVNRFLYHFNRLLVLAERLGQLCSVDLTSGTGINGRMERAATSKLLRYVQYTFRTKARHRDDIPASTACQAAVLDSVCRNTSLSSQHLLSSSGALHGRE
jgi:hypothetical protein